MCFALPCAEKIYLLEKSELFTRQPCHKDKISVALVNPTPMRPAHTSASSVNGYIGVVGRSTRYWID